MSTLDDKIAAKMAAKHKKSKKSQRNKNAKTYDISQFDEPSSPADRSLGSSLDYFDSNLDEKELKSSSKPIVSSGATSTVGLAVTTRSNLNSSISSEKTVKISKRHEGDADIPHHVSNPERMEVNHVVELSKASISVAKLQDASHTTNTDRPQYNPDFESKTPEAQTFRTNGLMTVPGITAVGSSDVNSMETKNAAMFVAQNSIEADIFSTKALKCGSRLKQGGVNMPGGVSVTSSDVAESEAKTFADVMIMSSTSADAPRPGARNLSAEDSTSALRLKYGTDSRHGSVPVPATIAVDTSDVNRSEARSAAECLKFSSVSCSEALSHDNQSGNEVDISSAMKLKYGSRLKHGSVSIPNVASVQPSDTARFEARRANEVVKFSSDHDSQIGRASMPGVQNITMDDISPAMRLKYGRGLKLGSETIPEAVSVKPSDIDRSDSRSAAENFKFSSVSMPDAEDFVENDISPAMRLKYGSGRKSGSAIIPGAVSVKPFNTDRSESTNAAENFKFSGASMPNAQNDDELDMSPAIRFKYGSGPKHGSVTIPGAVSVAPSEVARTESRSAAETLKFSSSIAASMSGSHSAKEENLNPGMMLKYGSGQRHGSISIPGAMSVNPSDIARSESSSAAENLKFSTASSSRVLMSSAQHVGEEESSSAMRLKYGSVSRFASLDGHVATTDDMNAAARLKLAGASKKNTPKAHNSSFVDTSQAERLKFGIEATSDEANPGIEGRMVQDGTNSYSEPEHRDGMNRHENDMEVRDFESEYYPDESNSEFRTGMLPNSAANLGAVTEELHSNDKQVINGWRSCFFICAFISFIIIVALSVALGKANKESDPTLIVKSPTKTEVIATTKETTDSPIRAPTVAPEDISFCYETDESALLNDERYSSIRTELLNSQLSTAIEFSNFTTYQRKSLCWLVFGDKLGVTAFDPFLEQRYALATIYFGFNEPETLLAQGWLSETSECDWLPLVECDSRTKSTVTRLTLNGNNLSGALPKEMRYLKDVVDLDLSVNSIEGDVLDVVREWNHLSKLLLSSNQFTSIPTTLDALTSLSHFDMSANNIQGPLPEVLASCSSLVYLDLSSNELSGTIPTILGKLHMLEKFYMHGNGLEGSMPAEVCALRDDTLARLTVDCRISGPEVECDLSRCCTACDDYGTDNDPLSR